MYVLRLSSHIVWDLGLINMWCDRIWLMVWSGRSTTTSKIQGWVDALRNPTHDIKKTEII
jgi:hypothetical protein